MHGSTPQELIQVADASMYLSKHQGGNAVSTADNSTTEETEAMEARRSGGLPGRHAQAPVFHGAGGVRGDSRSGWSSSAQSLAGDGSRDVDAGATRPARHRRRCAQPSNAVIETVTSLALAIDAKDHFTQGHSPEGRGLCGADRRGTGPAARKRSKRSASAACCTTSARSAFPPDDPEQERPAQCRRVGSHEGTAALGRQNFSIRCASVARIRAMVRHHHEMFDGSGYPDGLAGEQIPLGARIIAIADAYDTITSERIYKKARTSSAALRWRWSAARARSSIRSWCAVHRSYRSAQLASTPDPERIRSLK